ncbi:hypothetical protein BASA83_004092 [Batrachochytrium salamandrivorans]|nr:hypothetical protein BASA83_004092 [Batrachochytrium salamandrivorans]
MFSSHTHIHYHLTSTHPIQLHGIDLPSVSQYEYLGVIIDDLLNLSPWLAKKKRAITAAAHSISPLLRNNALSTRYRLTIFNGLVLGVAYYGLELIGGNSTLARRLQAPVNTGIRMILKAPLFTPIAPMLTDCGIISLDAHAILARVRLTVKATTLKTPLRTLLLPSTIPSHSNSWFWTRRSRSLIRFVHPNMSLFHFNIPISTNGLFHNPISTNSSITSSNISRSIPNTQSLHTRITTTSTTIPSTPTIAEIRHQRSKYALERTFQVWGKSKLACSYVQANHASSAKFLRSPALSTGQAIGASLLSLARCGGLWDYPRALKAGLLHPTATNPDQLGSPSLCILCHAHLDCKPMAHLVVDCTHPTVFFARVDTQLLQAINDTRVQIFDCTLHTTTTTTTTTTTPASPSFLNNIQQQQPRFNWHPRPYGIVWIFILPSTTTSTLLGPLLSLLQVPLAAPLIFQFFHFHIFHQTRVSSRQSALLTRKFPGRPRTQWKKTPLPAGPPPQTPTRLLLAAHPPRPIYRILGRMIF